MLMNEPEQVGLEPVIATALWGHFSQLREIQLKAAQILLAGENLILAAPTGAGKTEAVLAPLISRYYHQALAENHVSWLWLAPTRALLNDLERRISSKLLTLGLRTGIRHGDQDDLKQRLKPHVLLSTPESLEVLLMHRPQLMQQIQAVVVDEAHLFFNTQRGLQTGILLQRLRKLSTQPVQWAALSATFGSPQGLKTFLWGESEPFTYLNIAGQRQIDAHLRPVQTALELRALIRKLLLPGPSKLLLFCPTRSLCEQLASELAEDLQLAPLILTHYATLSASQRQKIEKAFAEQPNALCLATSTLELGIDIGDIDAVLLWGPSLNLASFLQQLGRGNRRGEKTNLIGLLPGEQTLRKAIEFEGLIQAAQWGTPPVLPAFTLYGAALQQILALAAGYRKGYLALHQIEALFKPWPWLNRQIIEKIVSHLVGLGYLRSHAWKNKIGPGEALWPLLDQLLIYGNFPLSAAQITLWHGQEALGSVPEMNQRLFKPGDILRFQGRCWIFLHQDLDGGLHLKPHVYTAAAEDFRYFSQTPQQDPHLAALFWQSLHRPISPSPWLTASLNQAKAEFLAHFQAHCLPQQLPYLRQINPQTGEVRFLYLTCAGTWLNQVLAIWFEQSEHQADPLWLETTWPIVSAHLPTKIEDFLPILGRVSSLWNQQTLFQSLLPESEQLAEIHALWLGHPLLPEIFERLKWAEWIEVPETVLTMICTFDT